MKNLLFFALALFCKVAIAQDKFSNCSAAFLDNKMIVEKYSPTVKAHISKNAVGELTVCTANISENETKAVDKILFSVAIKDSTTGTLTLASKKPVLKFDLSTVLAKCKKGDSIVLLTDNDEYSLPHNEILVE
jgi:hypothetical protein